MLLPMGKDTFSYDLCVHSLVWENFKSYLRVKSWCVEFMASQVASLAG